MKSGDVETEQNWFCRNAEGTITKINQSINKQVPPDIWELSAV